MYLLLALAFAIMVAVFELNVVIQKNNGQLTSILFTCFISMLLCAYLFFYEASDYARESKTMKLIFVNFITVALSSISIIWLSWLSRKLKRITVHLVSILVAAVNTTLLPFIALYTSCYTGLGCI
jgi:hypothetical protein